MLQNMLDFLTKAEKRFKDLGPIASDIESIKGQMNQLHKFKDDVDPHMVKVESLNRSVLYCVNSYSVARHEIHIKQNAEKSKSNFFLFCVIFWCLFIK
jgi:hypothetical protein